MHACFPRSCTCTHDFTTSGGLGMRHCMALYTCATHPHPFRSTPAYALVFFFLFVFAAPTRWQDGEEIDPSSLWAETGAVFFAIRRPG